MPESLKPPSPKGACSPPGDGSAASSSTHVSPGRNPMGTSFGPEPSESPEASPLSPRSYKLRVVGGYQPGEGSSVTQFEKQPRLYSQVTESLWDNPEFI
jgi:hypothetical protein